MFSYNTRFFIILENKHKLLKPILSRFCEIYVPEYTDSEDNIINLHEHLVKYKHGKQTQKTNLRDYIDNKLYHIIKWKRTVYKSSPPGLTVFTDLVDDFYYKGVSTLDIIECITDPKNKSAFTHSEICNIMMCFYRIKSEFRCEKMLMFYMLQFMFCSNYELPSI